ncbi:MAG: hypothetical protein IJD04_07840 [Desulfovibrionaceae bacterium]|nr:hypothetical protein [Desulfovibrionaceae bacterium]
MEKIRNWIDVFSKSPRLGSFLPVDANGNQSVQINELAELKEFLKFLYIRHYLVKPFLELEDYPLVESRELLPAFEADVYEHKALPAFSLVAFDRQISYFKEIFQFDILHPRGEGRSPVPPQEGSYFNLPTNMSVMLARIAKKAHEGFRSRFARQDITDIALFPDLLPYLAEMDRAQVLARRKDGKFYLAGVYASFPSDLDAEIKRFGLRIGKFRVNDDESYEYNRLFVYHYLMELYGFPIVSERRTSAALFARRLHKIGERFLVFVLGQSDRCLTVISNLEGHGLYPKVEKFALVQVDSDQTDAINSLEQRKLFLDRERRAVIMHVTYHQHKFNPDNIRQERALSVDRQEVLHPFTGEAWGDCNIIKDNTNFFLRLNDIVRGEYYGRTVYKRTEVVENTDTEEKRLKFLYAWLSKHQVRIIGYSDEFFGNIAKVLDNHLLSPENQAAFEPLRELYQEVWAKYSYIQQARKVRLLEDISQRTLKGERIGYARMLEEAVALLKELKFEIAHYFDPLVRHMIGLMEKILNERYLVKNYIDAHDNEMTAYGQKVRRNYQKLVGLLDDFQSVRKARGESFSRQENL